MRVLGFCGVFRVHGLQNLCGQRWSGAPVGLVPGQGAFRVWGQGLGPGSVNSEILSAARLGATSTSREETNARRVLPL